MQNTKRKKKKTLKGLVCLFYIMSQFKGIFGKGGQKEYDRLTIKHVEVKKGPKNLN